jgi:hypothetical protein
VIVTVPGESQAEESFSMSDNLPQATVWPDAETEKLIQERIRSALKSEHPSRNMLGQHLEKALAELARLRQLMPEIVAALEPLANVVERASITPSAFLCSTSDLLRARDVLAKLQKCERSGRDSPRVVEQVQETRIDY